MKFGFVAAAGVAMTFALTACATADSEPTPEAQRVAACQSEVKDSLKAPSTAEFVGDDTQRAWEDDGKSYKVSGSVDSQNSFGAQVRTPYWCIVQAADLAITGSKVGD